MQSGAGKSLSVGSKALYMFGREGRQGVSRFVRF